MDRVGVVRTHLAVGVREFAVAVVN
jgi:hypothetical protein